MNELLRPLRQRRADIVKDTDYIDAVLDAGNACARDLADNTLTKVHDLLGMTYANRRTDSPFSPTRGADSRHPAGAGSRSH